MERVCGANWTDMPDEATEVGEFAPPELGMPELARIDRFGRLADGRLLVQADWGAITEARSGQWLTTCSEEAEILETLARAAATKRDARSARNERAIAWMSRGE